MIGGALDRLDAVALLLSRLFLRLLWYPILVFFVLANLWSFATGCVSSSSSREEAKLTVRQATPDEPGDRRIYKALEEMLNTYDDAPELHLFIAEAKDVNAASFGDGRFLAFSSLAAIPDNVLAGIAAHEVAHDAMDHARRAGEYADVANFVAEALAFFSHADFETEIELKDQMGRAAMPRFSKGQELDADRLACEILEAAGNPDGAAIMRETLEFLAKRGGDEGGGFFDTHPSIEQRIAALAISGS